MNLFLNPDFEYLPFASSRTGNRTGYHAGSIACWNQDAYGDAEAWRAARNGLFRPVIPVNNVVVIHAGKRLSQFMLLTEIGLDHGDRMSLSVYGFQKANDVLQVNLHLMRVDSASGEWSPEDYGQIDKRKFPKHARGELIRDPTYSMKSGQAGDFEVKIENTEIIGAFTESREKSTDQPNTIGVMVEFVNISQDQDVWIYSPCLTRGAKALNRLPVARSLPTAYRHIPKTISKLMRGDPLHILIMGASGDRGSANPPLYLYDEDPKSPTFKQPIAGGRFDGKLVGHPEWDAYINNWAIYFSYGGRLRQALMQKFNYPINKLLLNYMAVDGYKLWEQHSGLADFAVLNVPPEDSGAAASLGSKSYPLPKEAAAVAVNDAAKSQGWRELYPDIFARPGGVGPDLIIFGGCQLAGPGDDAAIEGAVRWFQRHYPDAEFIFQIMNNTPGNLTGASGYLMEMALRYQIPYGDFGRILDLTTRHCNGYALTTDGHVQAAGHYLFFKQLEQIFDVTGPIKPGIEQLHLPSRMNPDTVGWEGDMVTYTPPHPRLRERKAFILEDTVVNLWATNVKGIRMDGKPVLEPSVGGPLKSFQDIGIRNIRRTTFMTPGELTLGDRHIIELEGPNATFAAVDAKVILNRRWIGVESLMWKKEGSLSKPFVSDWGAPYGSNQILLVAGTKASIMVPGTDFSVAYAEQPQGGKLRVMVDGAEAIVLPTNIAFKPVAGKELYLENRRGIRGLPYGLHRVEVQAIDGAVAILGLFTYDTRANRANERVLRGEAGPGDMVSFDKFNATPLVVTTGKLQVLPDDISPSGVKFSGDGKGCYEIIGE